MQFSCFQIQKQYKNRTGNAAQHQIAVQGITSGHHKIRAETQKKSSSEGDFLLSKIRDMLLVPVIHRRRLAKAAGNLTRKTDRFPFPKNLISNTTR